MKAMTKYTFINSSPALTGRQMVTRLSSFGKEEYPKGEVVGENASLPTTPSLRATPPSGRRGAEIASRCTLFSVLRSPFSVLCTLFSVLSFTSCDSERIEPSMNTQAITATAEMPKNLATLTRAMPQAATGLTLHYTAAKTNELAEYTVPDENITGNFIDGTFSFTTSWGSANAAENLLWGQVAKDGDGNSTLYLTANNNEGVPMWATATAAHGSEIAFGQMKYRKAEFWLAVEPEHNLEEYPTFTATMKVVPAAETADVTQLEWPTTGGAAETVNIEDGDRFYLAPQTLTDAILTIEAEEYNKTWTLDLSTVDVLQDGSATGRKANEFPAGQSLTLTVSLSLTQLGTPGSIEITDFTAAATTDYTSELGGTTNPGYTISADGKTYTVTNRYGLQAWLDAYAKDPTLGIVVDFPTENVDLTLPEAFATDTTWPVSGNTWAGKTWKSVLYVDGEGNKKVILDAATTDTDLLKAAILAAANNGVSLVLTGTTLAVNEYDESYFFQVSQFLVNPGEEFAGSIDLILPDLTELPVKAFCYSTFLQSVSAPAVTTIGQEAFDGCDAIKTIDLPKATEIGKEAFYGCWQITSLSLPEATTIGELAFGGCTSLATVTLPKVTSIGNQAFFYCGSLTSVTFGSVVTSIGTTPFNNAQTTRCTLILAAGQTGVSGNTWASATWKEILMEHAVDASAIDASFTIPEGVTSLTVTGTTLATNGSTNATATYLGVALQNNTEVTTLILPDVEEIPSNAFNSCSALTTVSAPKATTIGNDAFYYCTSLTTVTLPEATTIGEYAFSDCYALKEVSLPKATTIGTKAFQTCSGLTTVDLPLVATIEVNTFYECTALTTVNLPKATTIGTSAFQRCSSLTTVTFGSVITSVGSDAFKEFTTENCTLTLAEGQKQSTTLAPDVDAKTWAGYTWKEIKFE